MLSTIAGQLHCRYGTCSPLRQDRATSVQSRQTHEQLSIDSLSSWRRATHLGTRASTSGSVAHSSAQLAYHGQDATATQNALLACTGPKPGRRQHQPSQCSSKSRHCIMDLAVLLVLVRIQGYQSSMPPSLSSTTEGCGCACACACAAVGVGVLL